MVGVSIWLLNLLPNFPEVCRLIVLLPQVCYLNICLFRALRSCGTASSSSSVFDLPSDHALCMSYVSVANSS